MAICNSDQYCNDLSSRWYDNEKFSCKIRKSSKFCVVYFSNHFHYFYVNRFFHDYIWLMQFFYIRAPFAETNTKNCENVNENIFIFTICQLDADEKKSAKNPEKIISAKYFYLHWHKRACANSQYILVRTAQSYLSALSIERLLHFLSTIEMLG